MPPAWRSLAPGDVPEPVHFGSAASDLPSSSIFAASRRPEAVSGTFVIRSKSASISPMVGGLRDGPVRWSRADSPYVGAREAKASHAGAADDAAVGADDAEADELGAPLTVDLEHAAPSARTTAARAISPGLATDEA